MSVEQEAIIKHLEERLDQKGNQIRNLKRQRDALIEVLAATFEKIEACGGDVQGAREALARVREEIGYAEVL